MAPERGPRGQPRGDRVRPPPAGRRQADWALRWFTPVTEVALCGHATLATAHVLRTTGTHEGRVRFATRSGVLIATPHEDGSVTLDFPTAPLTRADIPQGIAEALGARPLTAFDTGPNVGDLLVELADEQTVLDLAPDHRALRGRSARGIIATAAADPGRGYDFVSRCFFPDVGIDEDPVTGSAHTALAPSGPNASAGRTSPDCRRHRVPAASAPDCAATGPCSPATRSPSSRANCSCDGGTGVRGAHGGRDPCPRPCGH